MINIAEQRFRVTKSDKAQKGKARARDLQGVFEREEGIREGSPWQEEVTVPADRAPARAARHVRCDGIVRGNVHSEQLERDHQQHPSTAGATDGSSL